ncbi:MAG TPA: 23S rRNA methyltransferase [Alphaproteobacteria bacterium]|nr:23S rRNA methyltransferase [Alphaproteobacteria bacterium]
MVHNRKSDSIVAGRKRTSGKKKLTKYSTKTEKKLKHSSQLYLKRQAKDVYVQMALREGFRSRAAYKLVHLNDEFKLLKKGMSIVDLGCAPGSWLEVINEELGKNCTVIGTDKIEIEPIENVNFVQGDFTTQETFDEVMGHCPRGVDLVLSDMAPETTGHRETDHIRSMMLANIAIDFALKALKPGGTFVAKFFQGGEEQEMRTRLREHFDKVKFTKPESSRRESKEMFIICFGFKGDLTKNANKVQNEIKDI